MIQLDNRDLRPLFEQIKEKTKELIVKGIFAENEKIPSVRETASFLAINPNTIQKAYKELENEGFIHSVRGKGYFVSSVSSFVREKRIYELIIQYEDILSELKCLGADREKIFESVNKIFKEDAK